MALGATLGSTRPIPTLGSRITKWLGAFALGGALLVILVAFGALTLARFDMIEKISGFMTFMMMLNPARVLALTGLVALILSFVFKAAPRWQSLLGLILSGGLLAVIYTQVIIPGGQVPPIHDITTDVDDPPQFVTIDRPATSTGPFTIDEWRAFHEEAYADIEPILIDDSPAATLGRIRAMMEDRGWDVASADVEAGRIEATSYAGYLKFRDDVVVEVTPVNDGSSRVDMRSVSQVGVSDLGYNAQRIRDFLADLSEG